MIRLLLLVSICGTLLAQESAPLSDRLRSQDREVLVKALVELGHSSAVSPEDLKEARWSIQNHDPAVQMAAIGAVARLKDDGAIPQLIACMRSADPAAAGELRTALKGLAGYDMGGANADSWANWHDSVTLTTEKSIEAVRAAVAANDPSTARNALHPLLMQHVARDQVVALLAELAVSSQDPRLAALAREGLATIDTAGARLALTEVNRLRPVEGDENSKAAIAARPGPATASPVPFTSTALGRNTATGLDNGQKFLVLLGLLAIIWLSWYSGRRWLEIKHLTRRVAKQATRRFTRAFVYKGKSRTN